MGGSFHCYVSSPEGNPLESPLDPHPQFSGSTLAIPQDGAPVRNRGQLFYNYSNKLVYDTQIAIFRWGHKPTYNWGAPSCQIIPNSSDESKDSPTMVKNDGLYMYDIVGSHNSKYRANTHKHCVKKLQSCPCQTLPSSWYPAINEHSNGQLSIYRWFTYEQNVIYNSYVTLPEGTSFS